MGETISIWNSSRCRENHISWLDLRSSFNGRVSTEQSFHIKVNEIHIFKINFFQKAWQIFEIETQIFEKKQDCVLGLKGRWLILGLQHSSNFWDSWLGWWKVTGGVIIVWQGKFTVRWHKSLILNFPKVFKTDIKIIMQAASTCNPTELNYFWMCSALLNTKLFIYLSMCMYRHISASCFRQENTGFNLSTVLP